MDALVPNEPGKGQRRCENGLLRDGKCKGGVRYRFVDDTSAYFTTWNMYLTVIGLLLAIFVYLPANLIRGGDYLTTKSGWWINYLVTPFIVMTCIVSIGVLISSQSILAYNFQELVEIDDEPEPAEPAVPAHFWIGNAINQLNPLSMGTQKLAALTGGAGTKTRADKVGMSRYLAAQNMKRDPAFRRQQTLLKAAAQGQAPAQGQALVRGPEPDLIRMMKSSELTPEQQERKKQAVVKHKTETKSLSHPDIDAHSIAVEMPYVEYLMKDNFVVHIAPAIIGVVVLLILSMGTLRTAERETVSLVTLVMCLILCAVYLAVPVKDKNTGISHLGWDKVSHVYSSPSGWIFTGQVVFTLAAAFLIPFCVIGKGPCTMDSLQNNVKQLVDSSESESNSESNSVSPPVVATAEPAPNPAGSDGPDAKEELQGGHALMKTLLNKSDVFRLAPMP